MWAPGPMSKRNKPKKSVRENENLAVYVFSFNLWNLSKTRGENISGSIILH